VLTNIDGLSSLTSTGAVLAIASNAVLINLDGLSSLTTIGSAYTGESVRIQDNTSLCQSLVDTFVAGATVTGTVDSCCNDESC